jgi:nitrogen fixation/metabolism regulation signal transduction histidine kinase
MRIHPEAYFTLAVDRRNEFVHEEKIGTLEFLSAYVPFVNSKNKLLAYINLPYFIRQDTMTREIANLVVGIVNFYVLLITLSVVVAVFISVRITQPLEMIQSKFGKITLGKTNEKINYDSDDEIGSLVREYNHMVDQLARSAEMLARSERESAWREMAKQIAHEIKNPLTPMKLSVQHLQRAWKDNPDNWEQNLERISQTLVEQIDTLSSIATEFSNFAQMPKSNNVKVNLGNKITKIVALFEKTENMEFITEYRNETPVVVLADKEQLSSVFINLIKNAIQSIPENRTGQIRIRLDTSDDKAIVRITDNGKGIPEELGDKLFQPNFTTKSSGMGLGLAIVKNIIDNTGGRVSYETEVNKGTTFMIELPLIETAGG